MAKEQKHTEYLQYNFTPGEKAEIATELAQANQQKSEVEQRKKQVVADFTSQITALDATIAMKARLYNNGYEYRDIECRVDMHTPTKGKKQIWRLDTGELVKEVLMSAAELQEKLAFEPEEEAVDPDTEITDPAHEAPDYSNLPVVEVSAKHGETITYNGVTVPYPSPEADALMAQARKDAGQ